MPVRPPRMSRVQRKMEKIAKSPAIQLISCARTDPVVLEYPKRTNPREVRYSHCMDVSPGMMEPKELNCRGRLMYRPRSSHPIGNGRITVRKLNIRYEMRSHARKRESAWNEHCTCPVFFESVFSQHQ